VVWYVVKTCCEKAGLRRIAPHDLRRTCAKLCHSSGGELEQIQFLLGHASVQTTERYLGCKQNLGQPVNDRFNLTDVTGASAGQLQPDYRQVNSVEDTIQRGDSDHALYPAADQQYLIDHERHALVAEGKGYYASSLRPRLHQELEATIQEAKQMAERIEQADELWELESHLRQRRKEIDVRYEFKYSTVLLVLSELVRERRISLDELHNLSEDKLQCLRDHSRQ
jgi:hypothetical protein